MILPVVVGTSAAIALKIVFLAARVSWPDNYFDSSDRTKHWVVEAPLKVLVWRLVPFLLTAIFAVVVGRSLGAGASPVLWVFLGSHIATTNLLALISAYSRSSGILVQWAYLLGLTLVFAVVVGVLDWGPWDLAGIAPEAETLVQGVWTAVCVAVLFAVFKAMTLSRHSSGVGAGSLSSLKIDDFYMGYLAKCAFERRADLPLLLAIVAHESSNRPTFVRYIELFLFKYSIRTLTPRTLGIAQQKIGRDRFWHERSRIRLNEVDCQSMERLAQLFAGSLIPDGEVRFGAYEIKSLVNAHNKGSSNLVAVARIYEDLFLGENAVMAAVEPTIEDSSIGEAVENHGATEDTGLTADLEVSSPWAVRHGGDCYVQFKVSRSEIAIVVMNIISSNMARPIPVTHTFGSGSREFEAGLFKVPANGMGVRLSVVDNRGRMLRVANLWFDADRDYVSVDG
ncbi:hypothetical protein A2T55_03235 [Brevibacterium linens]|uniref:Uncharacterized protein n=1 Tax=Brevibacterium linens TaxID=1703 RepID=A0A144MDT5_BRELN|nr:hypothetical protein [Brevibacterium linens]AMT92926.1 hypothetical protein A2T55_03235 [Brevibacterium linens]